MLFGSLCLKQTILLQIQTQKDVLNDEIKMINIVKDYGVCFVIVELKMLLCDCRTKDVELKS
jgi:hypothetical protein